MIPFRVNSYINFQQEVKIMLKTLWAVVRKEKIELLEKQSIPEGTMVLITLLPNDEESAFWLGTSQVSLDSIWNNAEDEISAEILKK